MRTDSKIRAWEHEFLCVPKTLTIKNTHIIPSFFQPARNGRASVSENWSGTYDQTEVLLGAGPMLRVSYGVSCWTCHRTMTSDTRTHGGHDSVTQQEHCITVSENTQKTWSWFSAHNANHSRYSWLMWLPAISLPVMVLSLLYALFPLGKTVCSRGLIIELFPRSERSHSRTSPCFLRPSPKVSRPQSQSYNKSFQISSHDIPQISTVSVVPPCEEFINSLV